MRASEERWVKFLGWIGFLSIFIPLLLIALAFLYTVFVYCSGRNPCK